MSVLTERLGVMARRRALIDELYEHPRTNLIVPNDYGRQSLGFSAQPFGESLESNFFGGRNA